MMDNLRMWTNKSKNKNIHHSEQTLCYTLGECILMYSEQTLCYALSECIPMYSEQTLCYAPSEGIPMYSEQTLCYALSEGIPMYSEQTLCSFMHWVNVFQCIQSRHCVMHPNPNPNVLMICNQINYESIKSRCHCSPTSSSTIDI